MVKFGTGGWRAIVADGFTKANVQRVIMALCLHMQQTGVDKRGLCIGYDRRFLSAEAARWAAEVAAAQNVPCRLIDNEAPTPLIMFAVREYNLPFGIAITASHNPAIYNGIKVFTQGGRDASQEITDEIERLLPPVHAPVPFLAYQNAVEQGRITTINPFNEYIDAILALVDTDAIRKGHYKIALDPMYGVSRTSLRTILSTVRCDVEVIHERHDTLFGGRLPTPNIQTLKSLSSFVTEHGFDLGIATDGDADRIGVIDDRGVFVHPNRLLVLLYYYLLAYRGWRGPVVRNNSTTHMLDKVAAGFSQRCFEVPVGFKHISAAMEEAHAIIGGESSGGLTVKGHIRGKDGIYAATILVEMLAVTGKSLSALYKDITDQFGELFYADTDMHVTAERKAALFETLFTKKLLPAFPYEIARISYEDGCKLYFANGGWVNVRFSGTEPLLRLCSEMVSLKEAQNNLQVFEAFLQA